MKEVVDGMFVVTESLLELMFLVSLSRLLHKLNSFLWSDTITAVLIMAILTSHYCT